MANLTVNEGLLAALRVFDLGEGYKVHLTKASHTPAVGDVWSAGSGTYSEADFSGYTSVTPSVGTAAIVSGAAEIVLSTATFTRASGATTNTIYHWLLTGLDSDGTTRRIIAVEDISPTIVMDVVGKTITVALTVRISRP